MSAGPRVEENVVKREERGREQARFRKVWFDWRVRCKMGHDGQWWANPVFEKRSVVRCRAARMGRAQGELLGSHWKAWGERVRVQTKAVWRRGGKSPSR